jgi:S-adenosylmethionine:tRNA ribosyltransferase-isomerase
MRTEDLDFHLPPELIAQSPPPERTASRLLHYRRADRSIGHRTFADLPGLLRKGDLLVFNDTRVLPARFMLKKPTGGLVEGLFLEEPSLGRWHVLLKNVGANTAGAFTFVDAPDVVAYLVDSRENGRFVLAVRPETTAVDLLTRVGRMPLPPYIKRDKGRDHRDDDDRARYQTVYARSPGAVAAPTAGLHFTDPMLVDLARRGVEQTFVTLHVGMGTFKPVTADTLDAHPMHGEEYHVSQAAADALNRAEAEGRRIVAVGSTAARVIEAHVPDRPFTAHPGITQVFIYPPYEWRHVGAMITNFHLPRSTLIAMVAALVGLDEQRRIYREAIEQRYRFFSYGDAMFVE